MKRYDSYMTDRLVEELYKISDNNVVIAKKIGCDRRNVSYWIGGHSVPNAYYLKSMYEIGMDVIYILTGKRTR